MIVMREIKTDWANVEWASRLSSWAKLNDRSVVDQESLGGVYVYMHRLVAFVLPAALVHGKPPQLLLSMLPLLGQPSTSVGLGVCQPAGRKGHGAWRGKRAVGS